MAVVQTITPEEGRVRAAQMFVQNPNNIHDLLSIDTSPQALINSRHRAAVAALVTEHQAMQRAKQNAVLASHRNISVLITGPTGTGKDLLARIIHGQAPGEFVPMNCAGFTDELFMSALCGHVSGAFTGAVRDTPGAIRAAKDGTVFLDEVAELPLSQQAKLLRILQPNTDGTYTVSPVGTPKTETVKTRFVFATNRNLFSLAQRGEFRLDLYARISTIKIETVPLTERSNDVPLIAKALCHRHSLPVRLAEGNIPQSTYRALNVRGLENALLAAHTLGYDSLESFLAEEQHAYPEYG